MNDKTDDRKLLPCPFCGAMPTLWTNDRDTSSWIGCKSNVSTCPTQPNVRSMRSNGSREAVITKWNHRTSIHPAVTEAGGDLAGLLWAKIAEWRKQAEGDLWEEADGLLRAADDLTDIAVELKARTAAAPLPGEASGTLCSRIGHHWLKPVTASSLPYCGNCGLTKPSPEAGEPVGKESK